MKKNHDDSLSNVFAVCMNNDGYPASLELHKMYFVFPDARAKTRGLLRIIDESGESYLYSADRFRLLEVPPEFAREMIETSAA